MAGPHTSDALSRNFRESHDIVEMHQQLNDVLLKESRAGRKFVLVIDEAQNLPDAALETVRLLTNFETPRAKLMQIVLAGQPQLADKLMSPGLVQLRQRISTICRLEPFSKEETTAYIGHRLKLAGYAGAPLFAEDALNLIVEASQGIPRTINNLCFNTLSLCCALKSNQVDGSMAAEAIADQQLVPQPKETLAVSGEVALEQPADPKNACKRSAGLQAGGPFLQYPQSDRAERVTPIPRDKQAGWQAKLWVPAVAAVIVMSILGVLGFSRFHKTSSVRPAQAQVLPAPLLAPVKAKITDTHSIAEPGPKPAPLQITVQPQQTLSNIAVQHLGNFDNDVLHQIQTLNPKLTDPNLIQPGQQIRLPDAPVGSERK
jgi:LysM repeat protein